MLDLDLVLAILHHLIVFALVAIIFLELVNVRSGMDAESARRVAAIDAWYGIRGSARAAAGLCSGNGSRLRPVLIEFAKEMLRARGKTAVAGMIFQSRLTRNAACTICALRRPRISRAAEGYEETNADDRARAIRAARSRCTYDP